MTPSSSRGRRAALAILSFTLLAAPHAVAQEGKRAVNHDDYDQWTSIRSTAYSMDGKWIAYSIDPAWGDGVMHVQQVDGDKKFSHPRGSSPRFSADGRYVIFSVKKSAVEERQKKLKKLWNKGSKALEAEAKKEEEEEAKKAEERRAQMIAQFTRGPRGPRTRRGRGGFGRGGRGGSTSEAYILDLTTGKVDKIEKLKGFRVIKDGEFLVYHMQKPEEKKSADKKPAEKKPAKGETEKGEKSGEEKSEEKKTEESTQQERRARFSRGRGQGRRGRRSGGFGRRRGGRSGTGRGTGSRTSGRDGTRLVVRDLKTGKETKYEGVTRYQTIAKDTWLLLTCSSSKKDSGVENGLSAVCLADGNRVSLLDGKASFSGFTTDRHNKLLAFTSDIADKRVADARKKKEEAAKKKAEAAKKKAEAAKKKAAAAKKKGAAKNEKAEAQPEKTSPEKTSTKKEEKKKKPELRREIFLWDFSAKTARKIVKNNVKGLPDGYRIQSSGLSFSGDGSVLMLGVRGKPAEDLPEILPEEKVVVDIWHWNDGQIQPQQAKGRGRGKNPTLSCAWHVDDERLLVLGDKQIPSVRLITRDGSRGLASDSKPYEKLVTWDGRYSDYYLVNAIDGSRTKILERSRTRPTASPAGRYLLHFGPDYQWYSIDIETNEKKCLTSGLGVKFHNELEDRPQPARAHGIVGWSKGEKNVFINDRYDIWKINLASGDAICVTDGYGRANKIVLRYSRFDFEGDDDKLDPDDREYLPAKILLSAKNDRTKARGYYTDSTVALGRPEKLIMMDKSVGRPTRAKKAERLFFTLSTFAEFPDVWVSDMAFGGMRKLTDGCPIQREVRWGNAEQVAWTNSDGVKLLGYLIKPDGFDPKKKHPMMVYFYERNADNLHRYSRPSAGTSPNAAYYVSNGYLWFVPDIVYTVGYPGESAEKCVISGVQHLIAKGFVDVKSIGMAGHSWGGYQTAHLVTRTNLFAAAESGAPVSNMFSAYGGIRYSSGMSRQFQYERTQSRIGGTPWEYPQRYWQNSPVFYADRVQTPVLILHNDQDGAVPWTNGIEFFMALRRMGKEAYFFNYNGEPHGLRKKANKNDWTRRMAEFFDHHLKGKPAARWMIDGVKYSDRTREKIQYAKSFIEGQARKSKPAVAEASSSGNQGGSR